MVGTQQGEAALTDWLEKLGPGAGTDTLLRFAGSTSNCIDITHAHPSGLAQFLAGRRTRLSMLLRDVDAYNQGRRTARALRAKIRELSEDRGIDVGYLASGVATWRAVQDGRSEQFSAPIMLGRISLTQREGQEEDEVQLAGRAQVNPALVRYFQEQQGLDIDVEALEGAAYMTARFDPRRALDTLREQVASLPGTVIEHRLLVSTFADLADPADPSRIDVTHPVISRLLDEDAGEEVVVQEPEVTVLSSDERHPADEALVLDADASQQEVLDLVDAGESVVVSSPPGTGQTQTAVNAAAILAGQGKRVLIVAERRETARSLTEKLAELDLASMALRLSPEVGPEELRDQLTQAILRNERAAEPQLGQLHQRLTEYRHALLDHVNSLHDVRSRWGCSPYQAMQELARLTSMDPAPATSVRLKRSVLDSISDREETAVRLRRAAEVGSFTASTTASPWYGARLRNRRETDDALEIASSLAEDLPKLHAQMLKVAEHSEITLGETFVEWGAQLDLLVAVRGSLDKFEPDIFDRSVEDLISATASSSWRRERGIEMSSITRSRLRRVAKEYVRPGVHISDLHTSIIEVQQQREMWNSYATSQRHPKVPTGLIELNKAYLDAAARIARLDEALAPVDADDELQHLPLEELVTRLKDLVDDENALHVLPERTLVLEQLREQGLGELLEDLAEREVDADEVAAELDLAWWQSALEAMISGDEYLAMSDGASLRRLEAEYRLADNAHIASGASRLRWQLAQRWKAALADHRAASRELRSLLKNGEPTLEDVAGLGVGLVNALVPVWIGSPLLIPAVVPEDVEFDAVILLDADALSLRSAVGSISRSGQVIAFGDAMLGKPRGFNVSVDPTASARAPHEPASTFEELSTVLPLRRLRTVYRGVDEGLTEALGRAYYSGSLHRLPAARAMSGGTPSLSVDYVPDGTGMPGSGGESVETTVAEVNRVVDLVFSHIRRRPHRSLAVIAANQRHAARIAEAISLQLPNHPGAQPFFKERVEAFQVSSVERAHGLVRDAVIFSLGYGRTPHGKSLHDFGALSSERGDELFVTGVTRSRDLLHLVSAVAPEDMDMDRVTGGARQFIELVGRVLSGESGVTGDGHPLEDPLVADLKERLEAAGAIVKERYRGVLDLAAQAADTSEGAELPLAVVSDGTEEYRNMTVRERSRLRPQLLETMGWRYIPLWTIDVFSDPASIASTMARYLGLDDPADTHHHREDDMGADEQDQSRAGQDETSTAGRHAADLGAGAPADRTAGQGFDPVLPTRAGDDDPRGWGDSEGNHDQWLREQRPPHWG
ncbi:DNA helicase [Arthrobacter rhombi]|uniref:DNA helicase n=1 Tax=Arthrobacter rhombi TaxID=71253 RepID=UPI003F938B91